jgi:cytidylate kinase
MTSTEPAGVRIAVDGPAGSGKSSTARLVARRLGFAYVDSGALYRAATLIGLRTGAAGAGAVDGAALACAFGSARVEETQDGSEPGDGAGVRVQLDGEDVTAALRTAEVSAAVSAVAAEPEVRKVVTERLRELAARAPTVMDGRDIGTVVAPGAPLKIWLDASVDERARRRSGAEGRAVDPGALARRDELDRTRTHAPLAPAPDAVTLLADDLTLDEQVARILDLWRSRGRAAALTQDQAPP